MDEPDDVAALGVCVPVLDERRQLPSLLAAFDRLTDDDGAGRLRVAIADNGSRDGSWELLQEAARERDFLDVVRVAERGPGNARTGAARLLDARWADLDPSRCWLISTDADNRLDVELIGSWRSEVAAAGESVLLTGSYRFDGDPTVGLPGSDSVIRAWPETARWCERIAGVVNPTGANHAVRLDALRAIGWYRQPVSHVIGNGVVVAGDDWDLGVRLRMSGASTARVPIVVTTSPRRLLADPVGYLNGTAHDGEFRRVDATVASLDAVSSEDLALPEPLHIRAEVVSNFLLKPVLLGLEIAWELAAADLPGPLVAQLRSDHACGREAWALGRDEFVYGVLAPRRPLAYEVAAHIGAR